jgi:hypothetical protein
MHVIAQSPSVQLREKRKMQKPRFADSAEEDTILPSPQVEPAFNSSWPKQTIWLGEIRLCYPSLPGHIYVPSLPSSLPVYPFYPPVVFSRARYLCSLPIKTNLKNSQERIRNHYVASKKRVFIKKINYKLPDYSYINLCGTKWFYHLWAQCAIIKAN